LGGAGSPTNTMWPGPRPTSIPSFILIRSTVWPQYINVTDRQDNGPIAQGKPFYKRSPKNGLPYAIGRTTLSVLSVGDVGVLWPNSWTNQDATWYGGRPWLRRPSSPTRRGTAASPTFRPMSTAAKQSLISATADLLFLLSSRQSLDGVYWRGMGQHFLTATRPKRCSNVRHRHLDIISAYTVLFMCIMLY